MKYEFTEPLYKNADGTYEVTMNGMAYCVHETDTPEVWKAMQTWITEKGVSASTRPGKTDKEIASSTLTMDLAYLSSTDWYIARYAEAGTAIPDDVKTKRAVARVEISELRAKYSL